MLGVRVLEGMTMTIAHATFTEHLTRVLHTINQNRQTGLLSVEFVGKQTSEKGEIFFERGETVFARTEQEWGETALGRITSWGEVYYSFFEGVQLPVQHRSLFDLHTASSVPESRQFTNVDLRKAQPQPRETSAFLQLPPYQALNARLLQAREAVMHTEGISRTPQPATSALRSDNPQATRLRNPEESQQPLPASFSKQETRPGDFSELSSISWEARATTPPPGVRPGTGEKTPARSREMLPDSDFEHERQARGLDTIFRAAPEASVPAVMNQMERRDRVIFLLLNGKRTIPEIARLVHRSEPDIAQSLIKLLRKHYIAAQ